MDALNFDLADYGRIYEGAGLWPTLVVQYNPNFTEQTGVFAALSRRTTRGNGSHAAVAPPPEVVEDPGDELLILTVALSRLATRSAVFHSAILKKNGVSTIRKSMTSGGASNKSRLAMLRTLALLCLKDDGRAEVYADKELLHLIEDIEVHRLTFPKPQTLNPKLSTLALDPKLSAPGSKPQTPDPQWSPGDSLSTQSRRFSYH